MAPPTEIKTGPQVPEIADLWSRLLRLHAELALGNKVTHPQRETLSKITKDLFEVNRTLAKISYYEKD